MDTIRFVGTITATGNRSVQAGVFSAAGNNMWLRGIHSLRLTSRRATERNTFNLRLKHGEA